MVLVHPVKLAITQVYGLGGSRHVTVSGDLGLIAKGRAREILRSARRGAVVLALGVDGEDRDELHFYTGGQGDVTDFLREVSEVVTLAMEQVDRIEGGGL